MTTEVIPQEETVLEEAQEVQEAPPAKKPRKPRTLRPTREKQLKKGNNNPETNVFIRMQKTEEGRALWKMWTDLRFAPGVPRGRPRGSTQGYSKHDRDKIKAKAKGEAKVILEYMVENKKIEIPKNEFAYEAILCAITLMRRKDLTPKDQLAAAKMVAEYTLAKPAAESTVTVKTAETFLDEIANEIGLGDREST